MRDKLAHVFTGFIAGVLALASATICMAQSTTLQDDLIGSAWLAEDIGSRGVVDNARSTLEFVEAGRVAGVGACNRYMGPVSFDGDGVTFGNLASTMMACPDALMDQERRLFDALAKVDRLELTDDGQTLLAFADGDPVLRLSRIVEK